MLALTREEIVDLRRWLLSGVAVLVTAGSIALAAGLAADQDDLVAAEASGAIAVDFAPEAVAPLTDAGDVAPGPERVASDAVPVAATPTPVPETPLPDLRPVPEAAVALPRKVEQVAVPAEQPREAVATTSAPQVVADKAGARAAAPSEGVPDPLKSKAVVTWRTQILALVEKNKRYPEDARARREQGISTVRFSLDRSGRVSDARIVRSSGSMTLDGEALALLRRAEPFPVPPTTLPGDLITVGLPIRFAAR